MSLFFRFVVLPLFIFLVDFSTKWAALQWLSPYGGNLALSFLGIDFSLALTLNKGAAWGLFASYQFYLICFRIALISFPLIYLAGFNTERRYQIPLVMIVMGASCNVLDYFLYGHVVDMFHFVFWGWDYPVFNVADSAIFLGVCSLVYLSWKK